MSVIVEDENKKVKILTKGADSIILERLKNKEKDKLYEKTNKFLEDYAQDGLRTLLLAEKEIDPVEFNNWFLNYHKACLAMENREELIEEQADIIERGLELIGSTAIEDKLQDEVGKWQYLMA
jgi:magnesium-transporting ATPase (P-type)